MKKRAFSVLFILLLLITISPIASSDVVMPNEFEWENRDKIEQIEPRRFVVNSAKGYVVLQEEPGTNIEAVRHYRTNEEIELPKHFNGTAFNISSVYIHKGEYWGMLADNYHGSHDYMWLPMGDLLVLYTQADWEEDNASKFQTYIYSVLGNYGDSRYPDDLWNVISADKLVLWEWPGSDRERTVIEVLQGTETPEIGKGSVEIRESENFRVYRDEDGRDWGYINVKQYSGNTWGGLSDVDEVWAVTRPAWVCLTDPENSDIPQFNPAPTPLRWSPDGVLDWSFDNTNNKLPKPEPIMSDTHADTKYFFARHRDKMVYLGRYFIANGKDGSAQIKIEPGSEGGTVTLDNNGAAIYVEYSCLYNGNYWGLAFFPWNNREAGWVRLDEFLVLYDYVSFEEEFFDELYTYTGNLEEIAETGSAVLWSWPNSGAPQGTVENINPVSLHIVYAYMDEYGNEWGFIRQIGGRENMWVNLSDPLDDLPKLVPIREPAPWVPETEHVDIARSNISIPLLIIALVATLAAISLLLIKFLWKPAGKKLS